MRHTRTLVRAEKPRPRATGQRWHELTSKFDTSRIDPQIAAADMQWRQRLIANQQTDDLTTIQPHLTQLLAQPNHPLHTLAHTFISTFNSHYQPLLTLSSKQSAQLLYFATTELDHFSACLANVCSVMWPELYSRDFHGVCRSAVFEYVCPAVYVVLFAIYKRVNYYRDASFSAKCTSLQQIDIALLGVEPSLQLKPQSEATVAPGTPTTTAARAEGAVSGSGVSGSVDSVVVTDAAAGGSSAQRQLSMLAPPVINTSSSTPTTPGPSTPSPQPSLSQPHTPTTSSPKRSPSSSVRRTRKAVTRLKTLTSFDRDMLKESERALAIADVLNQTSEEIEGMDTADMAEVEGEGEGEEGQQETEAGQTEGNGQTDDGVEAVVEHETAAPVSSLSAALQQLKTEAEHGADKTESPLPYSPSTLISPAQSTNTSPVRSSVNATASTATSSPTQLSLPPSASTSSISPIAPLTPHYPYHEAVLLFRRLTAARTPRAKLSIFHSLSTQICLCVDDYYRALSSPSLSISADDLLSILSYIIIKARLPYMWSEVSFIQDFVSEGERMSQLGYFLAVFQASVEMISSLGVEKGGEESGKDGAEGAAAGEDEEKAKGMKAGSSAGSDDADTGRESLALSTSLPSPPSVMAASPATSLSSLPTTQTSSAMLTPSASSSSLSSAASTLSAAIASSSSAGEGEESSAVLHMGDMSSLLNDTSLVNNFHFALPTPTDHDDHVAAVNTSGGRKTPVATGNGEMKEVAGAVVLNGSPPKVVAVPAVEVQKKKRSWLSRRKD